MVFSESLPGTWWLGAGLLVAGNVVIGMRDDGVAKTPAGAGPAYAPVGTEEPEDDQVGEEQELRTRNGSESESESENSRIPQ